MIRRWWFYFQLGWRDLVRLWATTQHHVIIVAGICLPIMMLLGLKRGHVETLRQDLITSPTGRQVTFWSARKGELLDRRGIEQLSTDLQNVEVIIPETQRIVGLRTTAGDTTRTIETATLFATRPGDPLLLQLGLHSPARGTLEIIIGEEIARRLSVGVGQPVEATLTRGRGDLAESATVELTVAGIMPTEELGALIGYVDLELLDQFNLYVRGFRVPELGLASARTPAPDTYSSYLIFCEPGNDLTSSDQAFLKDRGFQVTNRTMDPPDPLSRLLVADLENKLIVYEARTERSERDPRARLRLAPSELSEATQADDVVLPWNKPQRGAIEDKTWQMVGLSLPRRTWLREFLIHPDLAFDYEANPLQGIAVGATPTDMEWPLSERVGIGLSIAPLPKQPEESTPADPLREPTVTSGLSVGPIGEPIASKEAVSSGGPIVVVPANLLAWVSGHAAQLVDFDPDGRLFVPRLESPIYDRARLYARTIDEVPGVVQSLKNREFAVMSETGRISEIHRQDQSLQLLVWVVGLGVFLFGVVTVFSVLMDSTDRKRGTIGILRVMGMSRGGIFASILMRAAAIGAAAAILSLACGWGLAQALAWPPEGVEWLQWKPVIRVQLDEVDLLIVAAGAILCCGFGAIPPAWRASRLDPFDAIVEGRFR